jgi:hypothetical protein
MEARRVKNRALRERRINRLADKRSALLEVERVDENESK